jgi:glycosyltransferase involved in cell wall biosynthesis
LYICNRPRFSLIVATLGRSEELYRLFASLESAQHCSPSFEVIVVDQNCDDRCSPVVARFERSFRIRYHKVSFRGLSRARNFGLSYAEGEIVGYPDDDCCYYPDTLGSVVSVLSSHSADMVLGQIVDRASGEKLFKRWPEHLVNINLMNHYLFSSSITMFHYAKLARKFDCNLGAGGEFGSCEDADFIRSNIKNGSRVIYSQLISVWHPKPPELATDVKKVYSYAAGLGRYVRKDIGPHSILILSLSILNRLLKLSRSPWKVSEAYFCGICFGLFSGKIHKPDLSE